MNNTTIGRRRPGRRTRRIAALAITAVSTMSLAACNGGESTTSGEAGAGCTESAQTAAEAAMQPVELESPEALDTSSISGSKFAIVSLTNQVSRNVDAAAGMTAALESVGATATTYDGQGTPDVIAQAFRSAISQDVAGIVLIGLDPAAVKSAVTEAKDAGIPVIAAGSTAPGSTRLPGVAAQVGVDPSLEGKLQADYALWKTDCDLNTVLFFTSAGPVTVMHADGAIAEIDELCGDACKADKVDVNAATFATSLAGQVQTTLQRSPEINYLLSTADVFVPYILQGRDALGKDIPVAGAQGDTLDQAQAGDAQVADVLWPPAEIFGWYMADAAMRATLGDVEDREIPMRLVDESNWGSSSDLFELFPGFEDYEQIFTEAWAS